VLTRYEPNRSDIAKKAPYLWSRVVAKSLVKPLLILILLAAALAAKRP
jgi:hypothetical protein